MKIQDMIERILEGSRYLGTFSAADMLEYAKVHSADGIALAKEEGKEHCLAVMAGEPEGAIYIDERGTLFGDKAVLMMTDHEKFVFCAVSPDLVDAVVMGCRIFDKSHIR